jgi:hypothetical protein
LKHNVPPKIVKALSEVLDRIDDDPVSECFLIDKSVRKQAQAIDHWLAGVIKEKRDHAFELEAQNLPKQLIIGLRRL